MAVPMNRGAFPLQLDKTLSKMFVNTLRDLPVEYSRIATIDDFGPGASFSEAEISSLGQLVQMGEGSPINYDQPAEGNKKTWTTVKYGRGFAVTQEMMEDELFGRAKGMSQGLAKASNTCVELLFWSLFNLGFSTTLSWDGLPVFANNHIALKSGNTINNVSAADLSPTSLAAGFEYFDNLEDQAGNKMISRPTKLVIAPANREMAFQLAKADGKVWDYADMTRGLVNIGAAANLAAASGQGSGLKNRFNPSFGEVETWTPMVGHYLDDSGAWFLLGPQADFRLYWKRRPKIQTTDDFNTESRLYKTSLRVSVGVGNYIDSYGSPGA